VPSASPVKRLWLVAGLVVMTGGWMAFDGAHALITGDFVTPGSGQYAGQLGPWATVVRSIGVDPRAHSVKMLFLIFGLLYLAALAAFLLRRQGSWLLLVGCSALALLYPPFGTLSSLVVLAVLATLRSRGEPTAHA
jgi:hypothetical protein